jgi:hypothetical protein
MESKGIEYVMPKKFLCEELWKLDIYTKSLKGQEVAPTTTTISKPRTAHSAYKEFNSSYKCCRKTKQASTSNKNVKSQIMPQQLPDSVRNLSTMSRAINQHVTYYSQQCMIFLSMKNESIIQTDGILLIHEMEVRKTEANNPHPSVFDHARYKEESFPFHSFSKKKKAQQRAQLPPQQQGPDKQ